MLDETVLIFSQEELDSKHQIKKKYRIENVVQTDAGTFETQAQAQVIYEGKSKNKWRDISQFFWHLLRERYPHNV